MTDRIPTTQTTGGITVHKGVQTAIDVIVVEYGYSIINVCNDTAATSSTRSSAPPGLEVVEVNIDHRRPPARGGNNQLPPQPI